MDGREDATFVEHDVHVVIVPLRREDLPRDAKGRAAVMILLNRLGKAQRELSCLFGETAPPGQLAAVGDRRSSEWRDSSMLGLG